MLTVERERGRALVKRDSTEKNEKYGSNSKLQDRGVRYVYYVCLLLSIIKTPFTEYFPGSYFHIYMCVSY